MSHGSSVVLWDKGSEKLRAYYLAGGHEYDWFKDPNIGARKVIMFTT